MRALWPAILRPDRRKQLAGELRQLRNRDAGTSHLFWRKVWLRLIPDLVAYHDGEPEAVARDLITAMPAELRIKCDDFPTSEAELEEAVAAVVALPDFQPELKLWKKCGDLNELTVARAVLRGLGMSGEDAKSLTRKSQWEARVRDNHGP